MQIEVLEKQTTREKEDKKWVLFVGLCNYFIYFVIPRTIVNHSIVLKAFKSYHHLILKEIPAAAPPGEGEDLRETKRKLKIFLTSIQL